MKKILIKIEYIGTQYSGWQIQPNAITVQEVIQNTFKTVCQNDIRLNACSRTDAGVHAKGQVATLQVPKKIKLSKLFNSVNSLLPKDISIIDMVEVSEDYNVRKEATSKRYVYQIANSPVPRVFNRDTTLWKRKPLDIQKVSKSIKYFVGRHDFSAFKGKGCQQPDLIKTISYADVQFTDHDGYKLIRFIFEGSGFLKNMVRIMVGTLLDVAQGKLDERCIVKALNSGERNDAGITAPPEGLILEKVYLNPDPFQTRILKTWQNN